MTQKRKTPTRSRSTRKTKSRRVSTRSSMPWTQIVIAFVVAVMAAFGYNLYNNTSSSSDPQVLPPNSPTQSPPKSNNPTKPTPNQSNSGTGSASLKIASWNLYNFGNTKQPQAMQKIADILSPFDVAALQEISTSAAGAQGIAQLAALLNESGNKWDYIISDRTSGEGSERYAYLWKTSKATLIGKPFLTQAQSLDEKIDREPFMARFKFNKNNNTTQPDLLIANYHAVPVTKKPEQEIILLSALHDAYTKDNLLVVGDFNLEQNHNAFKPLKAMGYEACLFDQKTSIKLTNVGGEYLSQPYDNLFYETNALTKLRSGIVDFVPDMPNLAAARQVSDHLPVWCELKVR